MDLTRRQMMLGIAATPVTMLLAGTEREPGPWPEDDPHDRPRRRGLWQAGAIEKHFNAYVHEIPFATYPYHFALPAGDLEVRFAGEVLTTVPVHEPFIFDSHFVEHVQDLLAITPSFEEQVRRIPDPACGKRPDFPNVYTWRSAEYLYHTRPTIRSLLMTLAEHLMTSGTGMSYGYLPEHVLDAYWADPVGRLITGLVCREKDEVYGRNHPKAHDQGKPALLAQAQTLRA